MTSSTIRALLARVAPLHGTVDTSPLSVNMPVSRISRCAAHVEARQRNSGTAKLHASRRTRRTNHPKAQPSPLQERIYHTRRGIKAFLVSNDSVLGSINK
jgi:hypothetical protein